MILKDLKTMLVVGDNKEIYIKYVHSSRDKWELKRLDELSDKEWNSDVIAIQVKYHEHMGVRLV